MVRPSKHVAVMDFGKTNAKLALVDLDSLAELAVLTRPNRIDPGPPWPHVDLAGHWAFVVAGLAQLQRQHGVDAIVATTHGASGVLLDAKGELAAPMPDYEHDGPDGVAEAYDRLRPGFAETGSPRLPQGLNLGAQIHWMFTVDPSLRDRTATVVTCPQYWAHRLTGVAATDATSLGAHTDLWNPYEARFSSLVEALGLSGRIAPVRGSGEVLGPLLPGIARRTGLAPDTPVHCGIHDSNASLYPHLLYREPPFTVVSTGTWVIAMAVGGAPVTLDPARDTLMNVDALGRPVPSAKFMGGREFGIALAGEVPEPNAAEIARVIDGRTMLMPALEPGAGPYMGREAIWIGVEPEQGSGERAAAVAFYLALVTDRCLDLVGHRGPVIVEGPFARNGCYLDMLACASRSRVLRAGSVTGTSQGAALLAAPDRPKTVLPEAPYDPRNFAGLAGYAADWRASAG